MSIEEFEIVESNSGGFIINDEELLKDTVSGIMELTSGSGLTEDQISKIVRDVVVDITPEPLTYYTQGANNFIELSYY